MANSLESILPFGPTVLHCIRTRFGQLSLEQFFVAAHCNEFCRKPASYRGTRYFRPIVRDRRSMDGGQRGYAACYRAADDRISAVSAPVYEQLYSFGD